ncbi:MAG TPA: hypothetical protein VFP43_05645, partial [Mesorhizobium sp.]|nr:hypothetical protein [Mesorhizobium sp.]
MDKLKGTYRFEVRRGAPRDRAAVGAGTKLGRGAKFRCFLTDEPLDENHIKAEGKAGRFGVRLLAVVAEGIRGRIYLPATEAQTRAATVVAPDGAIDEALADDPRNIWCVGYGLKHFRQLFTPRQLIALVTLSDLVKLLRPELVRNA